MIIGILLQQGQAMLGLATGTMQHKRQGCRKINTASKGGA